jgi:16S rRNA (guanine527-N7)-methyltransferase
MNEPRWRIREWFQDLDERTLERLRIYHLELVRWTKKINLISPATVEEADRIHFADSILGCRLVMNDAKEANEFWDLGSGNGFPGIVLGILNPSLGVICVDSDERKTAFIKQVIPRLELENIGARIQRLEKIPAEAIGFSINRGLAALEKTLMLTERAVVKNGIVYSMKGADWKQELTAAEKVAGDKWQTDAIGEYTLPAPIDTEAKPAKRVILKSVKI